MNVTKRLVIILSLAVFIFFANKSSALASEGPFVLRNIVGEATRCEGGSIQLIQTDNGKEFQTTFRAFLEEKNIKHQYTWIHTPDQNGVVERSHRTDEEEFYQEHETHHLTTEELNKEIQTWEEYYNTKRLHFALNFDTPDEYLAKWKVSHI